MWQDSHYAGRQKRISAGHTQLYFLTLFTMAKKAKARVILVKLVSSAGTGYNYVKSRPRISPKLSMMKYDPMGKSTFSELTFGLPFSFRLPFPFLCAHAYSQAACSLYRNEENEITSMCIYYILSHCQPCSHNNSLKYNWIPLTKPQHLFSSLFLSLSLCDIDSIMLRAVWIIAFSLFVCYAAANTEKLMFTAGERPCPETSSTSIAILSPPHTAIERVKINPGTQHLFTLKDLEPGMRYEARISYPATVRWDGELHVYSCAGN